MSVTMKKTTRIHCGPMASKIETRFGRTSPFKSGARGITLSFQPGAEAAYRNHRGEDDPTARCLPPGVPRALGSPFPIEIAQRPDRLVILYEANNTFHIIYTDGRDHPKDLEPTWFGHSIGKWDGDTLVVDTAGFNEKTMVDTIGHPHSDALHVIERFTPTDAAHIAYEITIEDPKAYTKPWKNVRTFTRRPDWDLMEYVCEENNRDLVEGHIK